ncbi:hypothetical protein GCM10020221_32550 [Streptomyces thioluteus]|uniref:Tc1-like transposase DDE domain-containing protein n=1 Tax=Streptomyces thioluteus TaxID=66431 RepID=A0ABP6JKJ8_STRTU
MGPSLTTFVHSLSHLRNTQALNRACGAPGARERARRVREAVRGNGPVDETETAPRIDFTTHLTASMRKFTAERDWLHVYQLPPYAPDLNPVEGIWSLLRRGPLSISDLRPGE